MKTKFIFIRHAKSVAKDLGIVQGRGEKIPLSEEGMAQAKHLAENFKDEKFDLIFASTSLRAIETAKYLRNYHPNIPYEEIFELNERSKGEAEGMKKDEFAKKYPEIEEAWNREEDPRPVGGENFSDVEKRVVPIIEKHLKEHRGKTILYVCHGNVMRVILGWMIGSPANLRHRIAQDYCCVDIAEYDDERKRWKIVCVNRT